jgi:hypothetical protein
LLIQQLRGKWSCKKILNHSEILTKSVCLFSIHVSWSSIQESPKWPHSSLELVEIPCKWQRCPNFSSKWQVFDFLKVSKTN